MARKLFLEMCVDVVGGREGAGQVRALCATHIHTHACTHMHTHTILCQGEAFPVLKHQPTIIRAFKYTTLIDGDKDSWVERFEFPYLLRNILYFHKLYVVFEQLDSDGDHRISMDEFKQHLDVLGLDLSEDQATAEFELMDADGQGMVLFDELCRWYAVKARPVDGQVYTEFTTAQDKAEDRKTAKKVCVQSFSFVCMYACMHVCMCACMCVCVCVCLCVSVCVCVCTCMCACVCVSLCVWKGCIASHCKILKKQNKPRFAPPHPTASLQRATDRDPDIHTRKFKKVEAKIQRLLVDQKRMNAAWRVLDMNGNGIVSLAEVDRFVVSQAGGGVSECVSECV